MKSPVLTLLSIALLAAATGCTNKGSVIGSVAIDEDSRPVREARVVMTPVGGDKEYSTTADWGGNYAIHVKEGDYRISAQHPGLELCNAGNTIIEVRGNKTATVDLCLAKIKPDEPAAPAAVAPTAAPPTDPAAAPVAPTAAPQNPPAAGSQTAAPAQTVEVTPIPATEAVPAASNTSSQFPPSAAPTFPPAPVSTN